MYIMHVQCNAKLRFADRVCLNCLMSAPEFSPIWPTPTGRHVSWLQEIVQDTGDTPFQR